MRCCDWCCPTSESYDGPTSVDPQKAIESSKWQMPNDTRRQNTLLRRYEAGYLTLCSKHVRDLHALSGVVFFPAIEERVGKL